MMTTLEKRLRLKVMVGEVMLKQCRAGIPSSVLEAPTLPYFTFYATEGHTGPFLYYLHITLWPWVVLEHNPSRIKVMS